MRQILLIIALLFIGIGVYLKFFYDVPDSQEMINLFTSGFFMIIGISGVLINLFWSNTHD